MSNQKRSLPGRILRAFNAFFDPLHGDLLPLNSNTPIKPNQTRHIKGRVQTLYSVWPQQLGISKAGTPGGAADWIVNDLKIAGRSQFIQAGDVPGDLFASSAIATFVRFGLAGSGTDVEIFVTYIGTHEEGCPFFGALICTEYDPGLFEIVRESISRALEAASRGINPRPY